MAANNLRILLDNKITAVGGSSSAKSMNDYKSQYETAATTFTITTSSISGPSAVVALLTDYVGSITMTVTGQTGVSETTTSAFNNQTIGYGGGKYVASYFTLAAGTTSFTVTFSTAVRVSRFLVGNYWTPKYNTGYGAQVGYTDMSTFDRLQGGDLYTNLAPRNKTLQFDLQYIDESDKFYLFDILKSIGKSKAIFVSVFPQDYDKQKEQMYSIYGKLSTLSSISNTMYSMYSSSVQLEEI